MTKKSSYSHCVAVIKYSRLISAGNETSPFCVLSSFIDECAEAHPISNVIEQKPAHLALT